MGTRYHRHCRIGGGIATRTAGRSDLADLCWTLATAPVVAGLAVSIVRDFLAGRLGVDAMASMSAALALGQPLAGAVVALMYSGGNVLEGIAVARAEHDLRSLVDRAPREAHRHIADRIEEIPISDVAVGDQLLVRAGEIVPVDGIVTSTAVAQSCLQRPTDRLHGARLTKQLLASRGCVMMHPLLSGSRGGPWHS